MAESLQTSGVGAVTLDQKLAALMEEAAQKLQRGDSIDLTELAQEHPSHVEAVRALLPTIAAMVRMARSRSDESAALHGVLGKYQLMAKLGQGGMGTVYMAMHTELQKTVALKVLSSNQLDDPNAVARFRREMKAAGRFDHPNIVRASDAGAESGTHFLVMEYIDGSDLSRLVRRLGPLPIADACQIIKLTAEGLEFAHQHGLVHRDVKPSNIMLTKQGQVKILDLGLALVNDRPHAELTNTGQMIGTIDYMAPEQGSDSHLVDARVDVYSLGATLYQLLTGQAPFAGVKFDTLMKKMQALATLPAPPLDELRPEVPKELAAVVARMLAKEPVDRFCSAAAVAKVLEPFTQGSDLNALLPSAQVTTVRPAIDNSAISTSNQFRSQGTDITNDTGSRAAPLPTLIEVAPPSRRVRWLWIAAATLGPLAAAMVILIVRDESGKEKLRFTLDEKDKVEFTADVTGTTPEKVIRLTHVQPTVVGSGKDRVAGIPTPPGPVFDSSRPDLALAADAAPDDELNITRMFYCEEDAVSTGSRTARKRSVKLWVDVPDGPFAQVVQKSVEESVKYLAPTRDLPDGVYCLHTGRFSKETDPPAFCAPFIIRGFGKPETGEVTVTPQSKSVKLSVTIKNNGDGVFDDGFIVVTLQKKSGGDSDFKGRQHLKLEPIPAHGKIEKTHVWDMSDAAPGTYYFFGHVNYNYLWDANALCNVESETFEWGDATLAPVNAPATFVPATPSKQYRIFAPKFESESVAVLSSILSERDSGLNVSTLKSLKDTNIASPGLLVIAMDAAAFLEVGEFSPATLKKQKIIGIGYGAAKLFDELGLSINGGACAHGVHGPPRVAVQENSLVKQDDFESPMFVFEPKVLDAEDFHNQLFFGMYVGDKKPKPADVDVVALQTADRNYAPIVRQGMHVLVCVDAPSNKWSAEFRRLIQVVAMSLDSQTLHDVGAQTPK